MNIKLLITITLSVLCQSAFAITLHIPNPIDSPMGVAFYRDLLNTSLNQIDQELEIIEHDISHQRARVMLGNGQISLFWLLESKQRNQRYRPIPVGITDNMISKRILLIKKDLQPLYSQVKNLRDFKRKGLIGVFGEDWFDIQVWEHNQLSYKVKSGSLEPIYRMIPLGREFDYFSRGINEILDEVKEHPDVAIEENLVFEYQRDFILYLSTQGEHAGAKHYDILYQALSKAQKSGLIKQLVEKHWGHTFKQLNYTQRTKILLDTPE